MAVQSIATLLLAVFAVSCRAMGSVHSGNDPCNLNPCQNGGNCHADNPQDAASSYTCSCQAGFTGHHCQTLLSGCVPSCGVNAECINDGAGHACQCKPGFHFAPGGSVCTDIDECSAQPCDSRSTSGCNNTMGGFQCICKAGFEQYPTLRTQCKDIDECSGSNHGCHSNAFCMNTPSSFICHCRPGYTGDGKNTCSDINECLSGLHNCSTNGQCLNANPSFSCRCKSGYNGDGQQCSDIDECAMNAHTCSQNADCHNKGGSFTCACHPGFSGNGQTCTDIDECASPSQNNCPSNSACHNNGGSYTCTCNAGFAGPNCDDINECATGAHNCGANAQCQNSAGTFSCPCKTGFIAHENTCVDVNECTSRSTHNCHANAVCSNFVGGFTCRCLPGFTGQGQHCADVNECEVNGHNCHKDAACINTDGSYTCKCTKNLEGDGKICYIKPCSTCHKTANCRSEHDHFFTCECPDGYLGNGTYCYEDVAKKLPSPQGSAAAANNGKAENSDSSTGSLVGVWVFVALAIGVALPGAAIYARRQIKQNRLENQLFHNPLADGPDPQNPAFRSPCASFSNPTYAGGDSKSPKTAKKGALYLSVE